MQDMDGWSIALLVVAVYVAGLALVRLMVRRRDQMVERFREEVEKEKKMQEEERKRKMIEEMRRRPA